MTGQFAGFDESLPTCDSDGKPRVVEKLKSDFSYKKLVHIGDGATDMWAYPPAVSHCATSIRGYCTKAAF